MTSTQRAFFDVEDVQEMPRVRDMTIGRAAPSDVREFTQRYHYTGHAGADLWRWGLWSGAVLMGVVSYNNGTRTSAAAVFGAEHSAHVWHMGRLALADECPHNSESHLIGASLRAITAEYPEVWAVLTFAAMDQGHIGYVYQATNALYTGTGGSACGFNYTDASSRIMTYRPGRQSITPEAAIARGWTKHLTLPKHRYVYILGNKTQRRERLSLLKLPRLPYPKQVAAS